MIDHSAAIAKAGLGEAKQMLVGGELCGAADGATLDVEDPTTGGSLGTIPQAGAADVDAAVDAARAAVRGKWGRMSAFRRAECMRKLAALCEEHSSQLARVEILDAGIPRMFAKRMSVAALVRSLQFYAGWADKLTGEVLDARKGLTYTVREPLGVIASVYPFNVPLLFAGSKLGPALAMGNAVILKPAEAASLSTLELGALVAQAGFPPGVVQILSGDGATGSALVSHPGIDKISFTGGRATARRVQEAAAQQLTPTMLELGGKSPNLVFADADLNKAVMLSAFGAFGLTGQACAAGSRWLVHRSVHDELVERVCAFAATMGLGDPLDPATMIGPLISGASRERVASMVARAVDQGARLALQVEVPDKVAGAGHFAGPTVLADVAPEHEIFREEVFGPVLAVTPFDTEDEAIALANDAVFGLAAGVWTKDAARVHRVAGKLEAGIVWANTYGSLPAHVPFGGTKGSGWGKEGGREALLGYCQTKAVVLEG